MPLILRRMGWIKRHARLGSAVLALAALPAMGLAQIMIGPGQAVGGPADGSQDATLAVNVPDSSEAAKDLLTAQHMEQQGDWAKAAAWYQEVMNKYRTNVSPAKDQKWQGKLYESVTLQVRHQLAKWPAEGIAAYRARYDAPAGALLQQADADDLATLSRVFSEYFLSSAAKEAGLRLIGAHIERGEFARAAEYADILLKDYPAVDLIAERPGLIYRSALAHHLCGDEAAAQARSRELKEKFPDATDSIFGKQAKLCEVLDRQMRIAPPVVDGIQGDSWPMYFGTPDHSAVSQGGGRAGAMEYSLDFSVAKTRQGRNAQQDFRRQQNQIEQSGGTLAVIPAVDRGEMYFQDGHRICAVNLESGVPLPGWAQTYNNDSEHRGQYVATSQAMIRTQPCTVTLAGDVVLAVIGQASRARVFNQMMGQQQAVGAGEPNRVVCLDRLTGRQRWDRPVIPEMLPEENLRSLDFCDGVVAAGDNVFVLAHGGRDYEFDNCYVVCLDLGTGKYKWSCFVGSCSTNNPYAGFGGMYGGATSSNQPQMAYAGGRLYVLSNLGSLACIDSYSGTIQWLSVYERDQARPLQPWEANRMATNPGSLATPPWQTSPVIVADGRIFVLPADSKYFCVYDAVTGLELQRIDPVLLGAQVLKRPQLATLIGVVGDLAYISDIKSVYCFDWRNFDEASAMKSFKWASAPGIAGQCGRAFLTVDSLFVPTSKNLKRISLKSGRIIDMYPASGEWDTAEQKEGPGNVLVTSEHVILAGVNTLNVYTDLDMARRKFESEVAATAGDPEPHLRYAEVMFAAGQMQMTFERLDEAMRLMGGRDAMRPGPSRDRLYNDAITWAQKLWRDKNGASVDPAIKMFDIAGLAADNDAQQVNYRMYRARYVLSLHDEGDPTVRKAAAVGFYQQILENPAWRRQPWSLDEGEGDVQAAAVAEIYIERIKKDDKSAYAAVETRAQAALQAAGASPADLIAAHLLDVANTYPNSEVAPRAMLMAADAYDKAGDAALATHVYSEIYRKYSDRSSDPHIVEAMMRNYLKLAGQGQDSALDVALRRLEKAADRWDNGALSQPLTLPDGTAISAGTTFKEARRAMSAWATKHPHGPALPDLHIVPQERAEGVNLSAFVANAGPVIQSGVAELLAPPAEQPSLDRPDRLVMRMENNQVQIMSPSDAKTLATTAPLSDTPHGMAWQNSEALLIWGGQDISAVQARSGAFAWQVHLANLPAMGMPAQVADAQAKEGNDEEAIVPPPNQRIGRNVVINNGVVMRFQQGGVMEPAGPPAPPPGPEQVMQFGVAGHRILLTTSLGRIVCLDSATGNLLWQTRLAPYPVDRLLCCDDFTVVRVTQKDSSVEMVAIDNYDGKTHRAMPKFKAERGDLPVNMALSDDGLLAVTMSDRLLECDLYEPGETVMDSGGGKANPEQNFAMMKAPNQLVFDGDDCIAIAKTGTWMRIYRWTDMKSTPTGHSVPDQPGFPTGSSNDPSTGIYLGGSWVYCVSQSHVKAYNLVDPSENKWDGYPSDGHQNFRQTLLGKDSLVVVVDPVEHISRHKKVVSPPMNFLECFSRQPSAAKPDSESGIIIDAPSIAEPTGFLQWKGVDGGVCYVSGDHKLHLLTGARR